MNDPNACRKLEFDELMTEEEMRRLQSARAAPSCRDYDGNSPNG